MKNGELAARERREEIDLDLGVQVVSFPLEDCVRLLLDHNNDVSRLDSRALIRLSRERDRLPLLHSPIDKDLEHLALVDDLLAEAALAAILRVDDLALAVAVAARLLNLLDHRAELAEDDLDPLTVAALAALDGALLASLALALGAENVLLKRELGRLALVEVLERDLDPVHEVLALLGSLGSSSAASSLSAEEASSAAAKELRKEVLRVHAAHSSGSAVGESLLAVLVVDASLVGAVRRRGESGGCGDIGGRLEGRKGEGGEDRFRQLPSQRMWKIPTHSERIS